MKIPLLVPELRELLENKDFDGLKDFCQSVHPALVAEFLSALTSREAWEVLRHCPPALRAEIFSHLDEDCQLDMATSIKRQEFAELLTEMPPDDRVDLFKKLRRDIQEAILPVMAQAEREDIRRLASYPEGTAGAVMTSDYSTLAPELKTEEAIVHLRQQAPSKETIYYSYVIDASRKLLGFVSLKDLILARPEARVEDIMHRDVVFCRVDDDQEEAARKIQKFDLIALPVVDANDRLVGIITHDDALDIITQEQTEDIEKLMAIGGAHEAGVYLKTPAWAHFKNRAVWIVVLAALGLVSGLIVQNFEGLIVQFGILAAFMPMLADTGGNTGSQSATLVVRALALKEIRLRDIFRILTKEFQVSFLLALLLAVLAFARVFLTAGRSTRPDEYPLWLIAIAISVALGLQVITATLIGALLPLAAARMRFDPAVVASPALTTIVDITGLMIYFSAVKLILGL